VKEKEIVLSKKEIDFISGQLWELSEEEKRTVIPNLTPMQLRFAKRITAGGFDTYNVIAEVVKADNCPRMAKKGGKMVFNTMGELRPDKCDAFPVTGFCTAAIMAFLDFTIVISDRCSDVLGNLSPMPVSISTFRCPSLKLSEGGLGSVLFKVYCEKNTEEPAYLQADFQK
jgi:hypothetical protein